MKSFVTNLINQKNNKSVVNLSFKWNLLDFLYLIPQLLQKAEGVQYAHPLLFGVGYGLFCLTGCGGFFLGKGSIHRNIFCFCYCKSRNVF